MRLPHAIRTGFATFSSRSHRRPSILTPLACHRTDIGGRFAPWMRAPSAALLAAGTCCCWARCTVTREMCCSHRRAPNFIPALLSLSPRRACEPRPPARDVRQPPPLPVSQTCWATLSGRLWFSGAVSAQLRRNVLSADIFMLRQIGIRKLSVFPGGCLRRLLRRRSWRRGAMCAACGGAWRALAPERLGG